MESPKVIRSLVFISLKVKASMENTSTFIMNGLPELKKFPFLDSSMTGIETSTNALRYHFANFRKNSAIGSARYNDPNPLKSSPKSNVR